MEVKTYKQFYNENNNYAQKNKIQDPHTHLVVKYENQVFFVVFFLYLYNSQIRGDLHGTFQISENQHLKSCKLKFHVIANM
jgi:hypothetical protein